MEKLLCSPLPTSYSANFPPAAVVLFTSDVIVKDPEVPPCLWPKRAIKRQKGLRSCPRLATSWLNLKPNCWGQLTVSCCPPWSAVGSTVRSALDASEGCRFIIILFYSSGFFRPHPQRNSWFYFGVAAIKVHPTVWRPAVKPGVKLQYRPNF